MSGEWLPELLLFEDDGGDWTVYLERLYGCFHRDFVASKPNWPGKRVGLKRQPLDPEGREATFWHFISEGQDEARRIPDFRRCERIQWPRAVMDAFTGEPSTPGDNILWWKNERRGEERYLLALPDFSYLMVVADRGDFVLPWTQYCVEYRHQREKYKREYNDYWGYKS